MFCTDFGGWGESIIKLLQKISQYLCNGTTHECFVSFYNKFEIFHLENNTFILRKVLKNLCDMIWPIKNITKSSFRKKFVVNT